MEISDPLICVAVAFLNQIVDLFVVYHLDGGGGVVSSGVPLACLGPEFGLQRVFLHDLGEAHHLSGVVGLHTACWDPSLFPSGSCAVKFRRTEANNDSVVVSLHVSERDYRCCLRCKVF